MKKLIFISALLFSLLLGSCGTSTFTTNLMNIQEGTSQKEVKELLGVPDYRRFDGGFEEWEYVRAYSQTENKIVLVRFTNERVTGMDTFLRRIPRQPQKHNPERAKPE